jgi:ubiquitin-conjugating enzyme E2 J1
MGELRALQFQPDPNFVAGPVGDDLFLWHFTIRGPPDTPFEDGVYHGKIVFPPEYPLKPPDVYFLTPNGRFDCDVRICLNTTSFHPESWRPSWDVRLLLTALIAFLPTAAEGIGSVKLSDEERRALAQKSHHWHCPQCTLKLPIQEEWESGNGEIPAAVSILEEVEVVEETPVVEEIVELPNEPLKARSGVRLILDIPIASLILAIFALLLYV